MFTGIWILEEPNVYTNYRKLQPSSPGKPAGKSTVD